MRITHDSELICQAVKQMIDESPHLPEDVAVHFEVNVSTVRRWMRDTEPDYDTVSSLEEFCGKERGYAFRLAGYVRDVGPSMEERIKNDPDLDDIVRPMVLAGYRTGVEVTIEHRGGAKRPRNASRRQSG